MQIVPGPLRKEVRIGEESAPVGPGIRGIGRVVGGRENFASKSPPFVPVVETEPTGPMITRIKLHLLCPCKNWQQARFHVAGIVREFVPGKLQDYVR